MNVLAGDGFRGTPNPSRNQRMMPSGYHHSLSPRFLHLARAACRAISRLCLELSHCPHARPPFSPPCLPGIAAIFRRFLLDLLRHRSMRARGVSLGVAQLDASLAVQSYPVSSRRLRGAEPTRSRRTSSAARRRRSPPPVERANNVVQAMLADRAGTGPSRSAF